MFYAERNGVLPNEFNINHKEMLSYFYNTYYYFYKKGSFQYAFRGIIYGDTQIKPPSMKPSPEVLFLQHLRSNKIFPIDEYWHKYSKEQLFTVIEILYQHIGEIDTVDMMVVQEDEQEEFKAFINNILKFYDGGYYLTDKGIIIEMPNDGLLTLIEQDVTQDIPDDVIIKIDTATKLYLRFDSNMEQKQEAIRSLAFIIEYFRENLKNIFNSEWGLNKNKHDKLIFDIVNDFEVRHNNQKQKSDYSKDIWYDWMFHYYLSVIYAYYRLKNKYDEQMLDDW